MTKLLVTLVLLVLTVSYLPKAVTYMRGVVSFKQQHPGVSLTEVDGSFRWTAASRGRRARITLREHVALRSADGGVELLVNHGCAAA